VLRIVAVGGFGGVLGGGSVDRIRDMIGTTDDLSGGGACGDAED